MNANQILEAISETATSKEEVVDVLCDGTALAAIGVTDEDQEAVEEAYAIAQSAQTTMTNRFDEVRKMAEAAFEKAGIELTDEGMRQAVHECVELEDHADRAPADQLHYIINQAIPDGERDEWLA